MSKFKILKMLKKVLISKPFIMFVCLGIVYLLLSLGVGLTEGNSILDLIEFNIVISVGLTTVVAVIVNQFAQFLNRYLEEGLKLNEDYVALMKRYHKESFLEGKIITCRGHQKSVTNTKMPIIELYHKPPKISLVLNAKPFVLDDFLVNQSEKMIKAHETSRIANKDIFRLNHVDEKDGALTFNISFASFYHTLITNRAMDVEITKKMTLREYYEYGPKLSSLKTSKMANGLGIASMLVTTDGYYLFIYRGMNNPTGKHQVSVCNSTLNYHLTQKQVDLKDRETDIVMTEKESEQFLFESIYNGLNQKLKYPQEGPFAASFSDFVPIGLVRNIKEGGKPELYYLVKSKMSKDELSEHVLQMKKDMTKGDTNHLVFFRKEDIKAIDYHTMKIHNKHYKLHYNALYFAQMVLLDQL